MDERAKSIPTSRLRRTAKLGGLVGSQGARMYATKATNLARSDDGRRAAAERRQLKAAEHILDVLGTMKGAAMKVGQVASFVDTGTLPPEFQRAPRGQAGGAPRLGAARVVRGHAQGDRG